MTKIKTSIREYKLSDAVLKQKCDEMVRNIQRDMLQFNTRGVSVATVTNFQSAVSTCDNCPSDIELKGAVSLATENKDKIAETLKIGLRTIRTMAQNKWSVDVASYRLFGFDNLDGMSDEVLYRMGKRVIRVATTQLADLSSEGLTGTTVTAINTMVTNFDTSIDVKEDAINNRDIKTQDRIDKGNAVYKELMRFANIGKDIWASTDQARYNDYVIYDTPSGKPDDTTGNGVPTT